MEDPKLYLVHCGFYDGETSCGGVYEGHTNIFTVSASPQDARQAAKASDLFTKPRGCTLTEFRRLWPLTAISHVASLISRCRIEPK